MTRTCLVSEHTRRLPPRQIDNALHQQLRAEVDELRFARAFIQAFEAEMRKPYPVADGITKASGKMGIV